VPFCILFQNVSNLSAFQPFSVSSEDIFALAVYLVQKSNSFRNQQNISVGMGFRMVYSSLQLYKFFPMMKIIRNLLTELPQLIDKNGNIEQSLLEPLMPWSKNLPADCYSKRRN